MGRVARYKRAKELKGPSNFEDDRFTNRAPSNEADKDDKVPKGVAMFMAGKDRAKKLTTEKKDKGKRRAGYLKKVQDAEDTSSGKGKEKGKGKNQEDDLADMKKLPRESLTAFNRRVDKAAADKLHTAAHKNSNVAAKRENWTKLKNERKKEIKANRIKKLVKEGKLEEDYEEGIKTFQNTEKIEFGDVAMEPPRLKSKPKAKQQLKRAPLLLQAIEGVKSVAPIRQAVLEDERTRVIAAYRQLQRDKRDAAR